MLASNYNIVLERAADYNLILTIKDSTGTSVDLSDATFYSRIVETNIKKPIVEFLINTSQAANGGIAISLNELQTKKLLVDTKYNYDLFMQRPFGQEVNTSRLIYGSVIPRPRYTII
jgi:hypothetical protein